MGAAGVLRPRRRERPPRTLPRCRCAQVSVHSCKSPPIAKTLQHQALARPTFCHKRSSPSLHPRHGERSSSGRPRPGLWPPTAGPAASHRRPATLPSGGRPLHTPRSHCWQRGGHSQRGGTAHRLLAGKLPGPGRRRWLVVHALARPFPSRCCRPQPNMPAASFLRRRRSRSRAPPAPATAAQCALHARAAARAARRSRRLQRSSSGTRWGAAAAASGSATSGEQRRVQQLPGGCLQKNGRCMQAAFLVHVDY